MSGSKTVDKDHYLFREGDPPDAMYVVKSGKLAVVKVKQNTEVVLAEIGPGAIVGEMAFFDGKPRSASVKATKAAELIVLPYKALHAQFATMPEWCKAIMRTVNDHLRNANQRLRQLEKSENEEGDMFPPHTLTKLVSILNLVAHKYGKSEEGGLVVPGGVLRNYTIQVFQEATHKMQKLTQALSDMEFMKIEEMGEGRQKITIKKPELLFGFVEWYNDWLFKNDKDKVTVKESEVKLLNGLLHFARKLKPDDKGLVELNLTDIQNDSMRELKFLIKVEELDSLVEKKVLGDKMMKDGGALFCKMDMKDVEKVTPYWDIIYTIKKIHR